MPAAYGAATKELPGAEVAEVIVGHISDHHIILPYYIILINICY